MGLWVAYGRGRVWNFQLHCSSSSSSTKNFKQVHLCSAESRPGDMSRSGATSRGNPPCSIMAPKNSHLQNPLITAGMGSTQSFVWSLSSFTLQKRASTPMYFQNLSRFLFFNVPIHKTPILAWQGNNGQLLSSNAFVVAYVKLVWSRSSSQRTDIRLANTTPGLGNPEGPDTNHLYTIVNHHPFCTPLQITHLQWTAEQLFLGRTYTCSWIRLNLLQHN